MTPTLSQLLSDPQARENAPCVAVSGKWIMLRNGVIVQAGKSADEWSPDLWSPDGSFPTHRMLDCIWSDDLVAELAAVDALRAENERLREVLRSIQIDARHCRSYADEGSADGASIKAGLIMDYCTQALKGPDV
jgi:hypothetical protein